MTWAAGEGSGGMVQPGMRLGNRYELISPIAAGGMAQVWSGRDLALDRDVAVKVLHGHLATDSAFVARFRREAVAAARLSHQSIVSIYDTISTPPIEAIVMELIEGRTLRAVLDDTGALPVGDVLHLGAQIADALDEAHRAGIVHRDIKPANIMVCPGRRAMVTDFGIAKAGDDADLTQTGTLLGTAKYLSPEQVQGGHVGPQSDLYALGVVLFEALTGMVPFKAETDAATALARIQHDAPPVRQFRPTVPAQVDAAMARLMARDVRERFARASDVRDVLSSLDPNGAPQAASVASAHDGTAAMAPTNVLSGPGANQGGLGPSAGAPAVLGSAAHTSPGGANGGADGLQLLGVSNEQPVAVTNTRVRQPRRWRNALFALLVVAVLVTAGLILSAGDDGTNIPTNRFDITGSDPVIAGVQSFDPLTSDPDKTEQEALTEFAIDGDEATEWRTENYRRAGLGGLKEGVGLLLFLEEPAALTDIEFQTNTDGWDAEIYVGDEFSEDLDTWPALVAAVSGGGSAETVSLGGAEGSTVLLWITETGQSNERFRFELVEVRIS
ncbi:MAG: protein kinase [Actinomycetota bacterium]